MRQLVQPSERRGHTYLSEPAVLRIGATVYVGSLANWIIMAPFAATSGFGRQFSFQVLAFAIPFAAATIPAQGWLSRHPTVARAVILGVLAGDALLTPAAAFLPFGLKLLALTGQGLLTAFAAGIALTRLRAGSESDHGGRILGSVGGFAVLTIMGSRALGAQTSNLQGVLIQILPLLLAAAATWWLPISPQRPTPAVIRTPDIRWTAAACLTGCAVALTASAAFGNGGGTWTELFCASGFILSGVLLDTERITICIGAAAVSAVLAALSTEPSSGAISGLAQGLVQPLPWYIVMTRLKRDSWMIILACGQAALWAGWNMWNSTRQLDAALMSAMASLLALSIVSTFAATRNTLTAQPPPALPAPPGDATREGYEAEQEHVEPTPADSVADALKRIYGGVLTPRELQVGQLAVLGVSSRDIATQLYLSESTVKTHLKSLYRKTEAANRNELYRRLIAGTGDDLPGPPASNRLAAALMAAPKDPVTELIGRQAFERVASERMMVDQVNRRPTALLYIALRLEKGADKQSAAVAVVAGILRASLRSMDLLFRYGDYEFVVILPGSDSPGANLAGQRLAHRIRAWAATRPSPADVAVGWASTADGAQTVTALLAEAIGRMATRSV